MRDVGQGVKFLQRGATGLMAALALIFGSLIAAAMVAASSPAAAQDATWLASPGSGDFNTGANWSTATVPTGTAFFGTSGTTSLSVSVSQTPTLVGGWTFNAGASNYTFTNDNVLPFSNGYVLTFSGAGGDLRGRVLERHAQLCRHRRGALLLVTARCRNGMVVFRGRPDSGVCCPRIRKFEKNIRIPVPPSQDFLGFVSND